VLALVSGLSACGLRSVTFEPQWTGELIEVQRFGVSTGRVTLPAFQVILAGMGDDYQPLARCRTVNRQQSYQNHWHRIVYYAYPHFTDELDGSGGRMIANYYRQRYRNCTARQDMTWITDLREIADDTDFLIYQLQVYSVVLLDDYVAVRFRRDSHLGGGSIRTEITADVFDRQSGEKLALGDVIDIAEHAELLNRAVADHLRIASIPQAPFDVQEQMPAFHLTEDDLVLIIAPGELVDTRYGTLEVRIGWGLLG